MPLPASAASVCRRSVPAGLIACALLLLSSCAELNESFTQLTDTLDALGFTGRSAEAAAEKQDSPAPTIITRDNDPIVIESLLPENAMPPCNSPSDQITGCQMLEPMGSKFPGKSVQYCFKNGKFHGLIKFFNQDDTLLMYTQYVNGSMHGLSRMFAPSGELKNEALFDHDLKISEKNFFPNGQLKDITSFDDQGQPTSYKSYHENGQLAYDPQLRDGKLSGHAYAYYANGNLEEEGFYYDDKRHGLFTKYYEDGTLKTKCTFIDDKQEGECSAYYPSGKIQNISNYSGGKFNGLFIIFYEDGTVERKGSYVNGELDGECTEYYADGKIKSIMDFRQGRPEGRFLQYYPSGSKEYEWQTKNEQLDGQVKFYFDNPKQEELAFSCSADEGKPVGTCKTYEEGSRNITSESHYVNGRLDGISFIYDEGKVIASVEWKNGVEDGTTTLYTDTGEIYHTVLLKDGSFVSGTCPLNSRAMTLADYKNMMNGQSYCETPIGPKIEAFVNTMLRLVQMALRIAALG